MQKRVAEGRVSSRAVAASSGRIPMIRINPRNRRRLPIDWPMDFHLAIAPLDLIILVAYLALIVLFGLWIGRGQRDMQGYLLGGRNMPWWAILGSIVATETSTATFLSVPGLAFAERCAGATTLDPTVGGDLRFLQLALGILVGRVLIVYLLLPMFFRGQFYTAYQVLHERFGGATKTVCSLVFLAARNLGDGFRLFLTAIVVEKITSLPLPICVVAVGLLTIVYTFFGGIKSVIWNDCLQLVVYLTGGLLALGVVLVRLPGGWEQFIEFSQATSKLRIWDFSWNLSSAYTFWAGLIGGTFLSLGTHGTDQMMVQRYLCARSQREAGRAIVGSGMVVFLQFAFFLLLGAALACYYHQYPPSQPFERTDRVLTAFIVDELPRGTGMIGIILAAVFSAAMSTLSSSLNSSASSAVNDLYIPCCRQKPGERHLLWVSRGLTVLFGLLQVSLGIAGMYLATSIVENVLAIAGFTAGVLLGVFALGQLARQVGQRAALTGLVTGVAVLVAVKFGTSLAYTWYAAVGASATFVAGVLVGRVLREEKGDRRK